jgi:TRAP-type C4-dicarboxylate transport system permease small subunit
LLKFWNLFSRGADFLSKCGLILSGVFVIGMVLIVAADVFSRNVFVGPGLNATEYSAYMLVFIVYSGAAYSFSSGGFIRVELLRQLLPRKQRDILEIVLLIIALIYVVVLSFYFWKMIILSYTSGARSNDLSQWPLHWPQSIMGVGTIILILQLLASLGNTLLRLVGIQSEEEVKAVCHGE